MTQLSSASLVQLVGSMLDVDAVAPAFEADPPDDLVDAGRYWERREGMRGRVLAGSVVTGPRDVFASTADSEVWVVRGDSAVAQRTSAYARRAFRDAHPLDDLAGLVDNGNGYRILLGPLGVKGSSGSDLTLLPPPRLRLDVGSVVGGVDYSFNKYRINPVAQPAFTAGADRRRTRPRRRSRTGRTASRTSTSRTSTTTATTRSTAATSSATPAARASRPRSTTSPRARRTTTSTSARSRSRWPTTSTHRTSCSSRRPRTRTSARSAAPRSPAARRTTATASPTRCRSWRSASRRSAGPVRRGLRPRRRRRPGHRRGLPLPGRPRRAAAGRRAGARCRPRP